MEVIADIETFAQADRALLRAAERFELDRIVQADKQPEGHKPDYRSWSVGQAAHMLLFGLQAGPKP